MTGRLHWVHRAGLLLVVAIFATSCAAGRAFRQGDTALRDGNLDQAVAYFRAAVQADPSNANYKIALERAMQAASRAHLERAREFEMLDQLDAARDEYRLASEYDPANRLAAAKVAEIDQLIRQRIEASRPRPPIEDLRARARAASAPPMLNPAVDVLDLRFVSTNLKDVLTFLANATGINLTFDRDARPESVSISIDLQGITVEEALTQLLVFNGFAYKVLSERSVLIFPDTPPKHAQYDEQVVQTFYVSHTDPTELVQIISAIIRLPQIPIQPALQANKTSNTIVVRATRPVVEIIERIIAQNDKPRAEIVIDVEILEVNRTRTKQYGLNLSEYALGGLFSPEVAPSGTTTPPGGDTPATPSGQSTGPSELRSPPPFNLNTISQGVNTSDFYLAVPTAVVRFLESDANTKVIAKPQLRGAEGTKLSLALGQSVPVISTAFTPIAGGGAGVNPLASYNYRDVGVTIDMLPRVTVEGDIILDLTLDNSSLAAPILVAGQSIPSFGQRRVTTRLRLRDGESNLLAGLLQESERRSLRGFPGAVNLPILRQLFSANTNEIEQTDIVMLLTPRIIRTSEITQRDLQPIFIGSQGSLGIGGPPPLIAPPPEPAPGAAAAEPPNVITTPQGIRVAPPPGTTPVPGTVVVPPPAPQPAPIPQPALEPPPPVQEPAPAPPITSPGVGAAEIFLSSPGVAFRVGGGPYTVPISVTNASRLSTVTLTLTFDPALLSARGVQEGSFMRSAGVNTTFTQQVAPGRVDITIVRTGDAVGVSGAGLLGAVLFDAVGPGSALLTPSGTATGPGGTAMGLQFRPVTITVQP